jgi:hypothetical protein
VLTSPTSGSSPTAPPSQLPTTAPSAAFTCEDTSGGSVNDSTVVDASVGQHAGYDRFVIDFGGGVPSYTVTRQQSATFESGGGRATSTTLDGNAGVSITVHSVNNWTTYSGPTEFHPQYPYLREARQVQNYEGYQTWALGIKGAPCLRVFSLASPSRLVVDIGAA